IQLQPKNAEAYYWRGRIRSELDQTIAARSDYDLAIKLDPKLRRAYVGRGLLLRDRDAKLALADFQRAQELESDEWAGYYRADCLIRLGRLDEAEAGLNGAMALARDEKLVRLIQDGLARVRKARK